ncbi:Lipid IVA 3-deoxy-D-manno-octulosonic acid transferase [Collimonas arenae]|uniref:3-deoxy-D-manno-octulosonic acid transferase n=1 Tax=Collimonas arenae TaxID=279058 RepID=A0A0A1F8G8_9BURK|nr:lipid IV(A) 3-deoxy-D-manno-octulosonic acid transferase [Collimonas arenae]AIY40075.1 Lipid IVA 3-deoxy-D-manno-octulosonic acid transferase [Collimonas arenae]
MKAASGFDAGRAWRIRLLYSAVWWLAMPMVLLRLWRRGGKEPGYRQHVAERIGFYPPMAQHLATSKFLWVHAVSVGETRAAEPLIAAMLDAYPDYTILLTHMTATGRATGHSLFGKFPRVVQSFLPYDTGWMVGRFLRHFKPSLCVLMETEVWPNLIAQCGRYKVPVALVNARLSERSLRRGKRFSTLMTEAAGGMSCVGAQTDADAGRLRQLGGRNVQVTGSVKFDVTPPPALLAAGAAIRAQIGSRPVLLCASTREGEEDLILEALFRRGQNPAWSNILTVIVPRHPQRFDEVAQLAAAKGLSSLRRTGLGSDAVPPETRILVGDSMGEMFAYYAVCDVAFIGGSLLPMGGQNLIEAFAVGKPVLIGPHTFNFSAITEQAIAAGAARRVTDVENMLDEALYLLQSREQRQAMGQQASSFARQHRGATARTMALLQPLISSEFSVPCTSP